MGCGSICNGNRSDILLRIFNVRAGWRFKGDTMNHDFLTPGPYMTSRELLEWMYDEDWDKTEQEDEDERERDSIKTSTRIELGNH